VDGRSFDQIISEELASFANQVSCIDCRLILNTPTAQSFALIIHELATNAVKYGALSRPEGHVTVQGQIQWCEGNDLFRFTWTETGGPTVELPQRKGFGSSILCGIARQFAQTVQMTYQPQGLIYELQVPLGSIQAPEPNRITRWRRTPQNH
jgi:two-component sensor histidine kinase